MTATTPTHCDYCRAPLLGPGLSGRARPDLSVPTYCCYGCLSLGESSQAGAGAGWRIDGLMLRLAASIILAGQSMTFGLAINLTGEADRTTRLLLQGGVLLATLLVMLMLGGPLARNAIREWRAGRLTIEALFVLTLVGAFVASMQAFIQTIQTGQSQPIYFEVVSILLIVYTLGKLIGARAKEAALASTERWAKSLATCRLIDTLGRVREVPVSEIYPGDVVEVRPGEMIAVDGIIREGTAFVAESAVSGEAFAVVRRPGDRVLAGSSSQDAVLRIVADTPGQQRQIDRLLAMVEAARTTPTSVQGQADRVGRIFFPVVVGIATATFIGWTWHAGWEVGLYRAMSVLLVACPCALGLAVPIALWSTLARLAERGLLIRQGDVVERLARVDCVVFDKTGTLTEERFALLDIATRATGEERAKLLGWIAAVQARSTHPVARALAAMNGPLGVDEAAVRVDSVQVVPGQGIIATLSPAHAPDGPTHTMRLGRPDWLGSDARPESAELLAQLRSTVGHRVDVELDGRLVAVAVLAERLRESAPQALTALANMGLPVQVMTGDSAERAAALGLPPTQARMLPTDKLAAVEQMRAAGRKPLMVGDGVNDAAALARAEVGVALAEGTDLANSAALVTLYSPDLRLLPWAIALARRTLATIRRNLVIAAGYNLIGMALAASGWLDPVVAALLMMVSSFWVAWSSLHIGVTPQECGVVPAKPTPASASAAPTTHAGEPAAPASPAPASPALAAPPAHLADATRTHALAVLLQGYVAAALLGLSGWQTLGLAGAAGLVGVLTAWGWRRWAGIPHWVDMNYGMLTLGNLGMLVGWWMDAGWRPLTSGYCECGAGGLAGLTAQPGMWLGMLVGANLAMLGCMRKPCPEVPFAKLAMYGGGNVGMILGMFAGGWLAGLVPLTPLWLAFASNFVGMSVGMIGGMIAGYALGLVLLPLLARLGLAPVPRLRAGQAQPIEAQRAEEVATR